MIKGNSNGHSLPPYSPTFGVSQLAQSSNKNKMPGGCPLQTNMH